MSAGTGYDLGGWGSAEVIPIADIQVDPDYQRDLRHDLINRIGRDYDMVKAGPILVSRRADGSLWCVDGQHRMYGAQQAGETEVFANVVPGLTQEQEAELRLARNDRKPDSIYEKFRTRLVMGDPKAHAIVELVRQHDTEVNLTPSTYRGINAIGTLEQLWDVDGRGTWLGRTLKALHDAYGAEQMDPETCSVSMLKAVAWFIAQHIDSHEVSYQAFVERLATHGPEDIRRKAVNHKAALGGAMWVNFYRSLVELWNFRRQPKQQLRWKTVGSFTQLSDNSGPKSGWAKSGRGGDGGGND